MGERRREDPRVWSALDKAFADLVRRKSEATGADARSVDTAAFAAGFVSREITDGHSCVEFDTIAGSLAGQTSADGDFETWRAMLLASGVVSDGSRVMPLILDERGRLYLHRHFRAEAKIADAIFALAERPGPVDDPAQLAGVFAKLFPEAATDEGDRQALAAGVAAVRRLTIVAGGPGTGKTSAVAKILGLLASADPAIRIALVAPTGKAAKRLSESISDQIESLAIAPETKHALAVQAATLHRFLAYSPKRGEFARNGGSPVAADVVVVDEASMVDSALFEALFDALPASASLILLGDPDQLESVGSGYVFGDLCAALRAGRGRSEGLVRGYRALGGKIADADSAAAAIDDCAVELVRSYRFRPGTSLARIAATIRSGNAETFLSDCAASGEVEIVEPPATAEALVARCLEDLKAFASAKTLEDGFVALERFRVLCALREGPLGATAMNAAIARALGLSGRAASSIFFDRRALMVTANNYALRLFNGDVGLCWARDGRTSVFFPGTDGALREIRASQLPACESAWAMTVHKSQGSEFDEIMLVLPDAPSPVLSRELLYTGATRAKSRLTIVATEDSLRTALSITAGRASGLRDRLAARMKRDGG